jgi:hypothetical protein
MQVHPRSILICLLRNQFSLAKSQQQRLPSDIPRASNESTLALVAFRPMLISCAATGDLAHSGARRSFSVGFGWRVPIGDSEPREAVAGEGSVAYTRLEVDILVCVAFGRKELTVELGWFFPVAMLGNAWSTSMSPPGQKLVESSFGSYRLLSPFAFLLICSTASA